MFLIEKKTDTLSVHRRDTNAVIGGEKSSGTNAVRSEWKSIKNIDTVSCEPPPGTRNYNVTDAVFRQ